MFAAMSFFNLLICLHSYSIPMVGVFLFICACACVCVHICIYCVFLCLYSYMCVCVYYIHVVVVSADSLYRQLPCQCHGSMPGKTAVELGPLW